MKNVLITAALIAIVMVVLACSGTPDIIGPNPPPGPGPGTTPVLTLTVEERLAVLKECGTVADMLGDLRSAAAQQALVVYLKSRPEFEEADTLGGNVWAYFYDGRVAMFVPNWLGGGGVDGGRMMQPAPGAGKKKSHSAGRTSGQPASNEVKLFFGMGTAFEDFRPVLMDLFKESGTDYSVVPVTATIENLKNTNGLGIFYINTHGGLGYRKPRSARVRQFALWTADTVTNERERTYEADLNSNYLVYMRALHDLGSGAEWHYAFTDRFVRNHAYMNFAENALVYVDACESMSTYASMFRQSMIGKAQGGKASYIGWTGVTDYINETAGSVFIFSRMLGINRDLSIFEGSIEAEDPKQRPFDLAKIFADMRSQTVEGHPIGITGYGGDLAYDAVSTSEIILRPSISYINVDEYASRITIKGLFGDKDGVAKVTVGGIAVPVAHWSANELVCDIPVTGPGSSGDVIVTINKNKSNTVPLSEWTIPLHLIQDEFGIKVDARLNLKIRADVHKFRLKPGEDPITERPDAIEPPPGFLGFPFSIASSGSFTAGGTRTSSCRVGPCTIRDTEAALTQNGTLKFSIVPSGGRDFSAYYKWSKDLKKIEVFVSVYIPNVGMEMELYTACDGDDPKTARHSQPGTLGIFTSKSPGIPVLQFHLDENYSFKKDDINGTQNMPWGRCELPGYFKHSASWPAVVPTVRPTAETEARYAGGD